jgi:hypothetical protein
MQKIRYIDAIFEKEDNGECYSKDSLLLQDLICYPLIINELPLAKEVHFKKRELQNWVVRNNKEIIDYYNETLQRRNTTYGNRIHGKEERLNNAFEILKQLNLIQSAWLAPAEKTGTPVTTYKYTKGAILLALTIKSMKHKKDLETYKNIYDLFHLAFEVKADSLASTIFYQNLFRKCKGKGILNKFVERIEYVINADSNILNIADLVQRAIYLAFLSRQSDTDFLDAWHETIEALDRGNQKLILYEMKMFAENKFNNNQESLTRRYEKFRFDMRSHYERIALQGFCEECKSSQNVPLHYSDLIRHGISKDLRVDCPSCNTKKSLFIKF